MTTIFDKIREKHDQAVGKSPAEPAADRIQQLRELTAKGCAYLYENPRWAKGDQDYTDEEREEFDRKQAALKRLEDELLDLERMKDKPRSASMPGKCARCGKESKFMMDEHYICYACYRKRIRA